MCMELFVLMPLTNGRTWEQPAIPLGSVFGLHSHDEAEKERENRISRNERMPREVRETPNKTIVA